MTFSVILSLVLAMIWVTACVLLLFNLTKQRLPDELGMLAYCGVIFLVLFALTLWLFRFRLSLALPVAALSSSIWFLAVWLVSAGKYLK